MSMIAGTARSMGRRGRLRRRREKQCLEVKKYVESAKKIEKGTLYDAAEAMDLVEDRHRQVRRDRRAARQAGR